MMDLVFCGTPLFAVPTLERLVSEGFRIKMVATQPDDVVEDLARYRAGDLVPATGSRPARLPFALVPDLARDRYGFRLALSF